MRLLIIAMPCSAILPLTITTSASIILVNFILAFGCITPIPDVLMNILSPFPFSTTLVSPVTTWTLALVQHSFILFKICQKVSIGKPSSIIKDSDKYFAIAPHIAKSLTVPLIANSPILPPGKKSGFTT